MNNASVMDQIIDTLTFEVEAIPQDKEEISVAPLKFKIRLRKTDKMKKILRGITAVPKINDAKYASDKIQTSSSEQTLTSFEVFMTDEETMKKPIRKQKRVLYLFKKAGCLGTHIEKEEYVYSKCTSREVNENTLQPIISTSTNSCEKRNFTLVKNIGSFETSRQGKETHKDLLGKCKPGGCLDPPFSEDKYMYLPKIIQMKNRSMVKSDNDNLLENKEQPLSPINTICLNVKKSNSIITYPSISSTELSDKDNVQKSVKDKRRSKDYTESNNSPKKIVETYYIAPKKIKLSSTKEEGCNKSDHNTTKRCSEISSLQFENNSHGQKIETLKHGDGTIKSTSSLFHENKQETNFNTTNDNSESSFLNSYNSNHGILDNNNNLLQNTTSLIYSTEPVIPFSGSISVQTFPSYNEKRNSIVNGENAVGMKFVENIEMCAQINTMDKEHTEILTKNTSIQELKNDRIYSNISLPEVQEKLGSQTGKHLVADSEILKPVFSPENFKTNYLREGAERKSIDQNSSIIGQNYVTDNLYNSKYQTSSPIIRNTSIMSTLEGNDNVQNTEKAIQDTYHSNIPSINEYLNLDAPYTVVNRGITNKNNTNSNIDGQGNSELFDENNDDIVKLSISNIINATNSKQLPSNNEENYFLTESDNNEITNHVNNNLLPMDTMEAEEMSSAIFNSHKVNDCDIAFKNQENKGLEQFDEKQMIGVKSVTDMFIESANNAAISLQSQNEHETSLIKEPAQYSPKDTEKKDKINYIYLNSKPIENTGDIINSNETDNSKSDDTSILTNSRREDNLRDDTNYIDIDISMNKDENILPASQHTINKDQNLKKINHVQENFLPENFIYSPNIGNEPLQNTSEKIFPDTPGELSSSTIKKLEQDGELRKSLILNSFNINKETTTESTNSNFHSFEENSQTSGKLPLESVITPEENKFVGKDSNTDFLLNNNDIESQTREIDYKNVNDSPKISSITKEKSTEQLNTSIKRKLETTGGPNQKNSKNPSLSNTSLIDLNNRPPEQGILQGHGRNLNSKNNQDEDVIYLNMAFQKLITEKDKTFIRTLNTTSSNENKPYLKENILKLNTIMRPGESPVTIPIDNKNNLTLQITKAAKNTNQNQLTIKSSLADYSNASRKFNKDKNVLPTKSDFNNNGNIHMKKYIKDGKDYFVNLQQTLDSVYDKNLVPLHDIIKNLRDDVDGLAMKKNLVQDTHNKNPEKASRRQTNQKCGCVQFLL